MQLDFERMNARVMHNVTYASNEKWGVDISYVWTAEGWLYLAIVVDLFSRKIVDGAVSDRMKRSLVLCALQRAMTMPSPPTGMAAQ